MGTRDVMSDEDLNELAIQDPTYAARVARLLGKELPGSRPKKAQGPKASRRASSLPPSRPSSAMSVLAAHKARYESLVRAQRMGNEAITEEMVSQAWGKWVDYEILGIDDGELPEMGELPEESIELERIAGDARRLLLECEGLLPEDLLGRAMDLVTRIDVALGPEGEG